MSTIIIIGAGSFGTALANTFAQKHNITLIDNNKTVVSDINKNHKNSRYTSKKLNPTIKAKKEFAGISEADIIIIATPSKAIVPLLSKLKEKVRKDQIIISVTKGLTKEGKTITTYLEEALEIDTKKVFALSGPSIANELLKGHITDMVLGGDKRKGNKLAKELSTKTLLIRTTSDKIGIQLLGFYKNIIAILTGLSKSIGVGENTTSALITTAYRNFYRQNITRMRRHTFVDYAGLGDLIVTIQSTQSRNYSFGKHIGKGKTINQAKKAINQTIEGYTAIQTILQLKKQQYFDMELLHTLNNIFRTTSKEKQQQLLETYLQQQYV
ncbi:MAG: NAD(P)H-dependent glycerol-3-phosphate dehydrogenase [Nanobdellota archaeon]